MNTITFFHANVTLNVMLTIMSTYATSNSLNSAGYQRKATLTFDFGVMATFDKSQQNRLNKTKKSVKLNGDYGMCERSLTF